MSRKYVLLLVGLFLIGALLVAGSFACKRGPGVLSPPLPQMVGEEKIAKLAANIGLDRKYISGEYPEPRFPSYIVPPKSVEEAMPFARAAVQQIGGRTPLGLVKPGQTVLLILELADNMILVEAVKRAYEERGVKVNLEFSYDLAGVGKEKAQELREVREGVRGQHLGLREMEGWLSRFEDPEVPKEWLKARRLDLYEAIYAGLETPKHLKEVEERLSTVKLGRNIIKYLDANPKVDAVYWGTGGRRRGRELLHYQPKFLGNFIFGRPQMLLSKVPDFPGDLWRLIEERTIEPLAYGNRVEAFDPEGTKMAWDMTEEEAKAWGKGVYQQGHLFMIPTQSTGKYPYSVVDYPALGGEYIPKFQTVIAGVTAGTSNHAGIAQRIEAHYKDGRIIELRGEGPYAETWRYFVENYEPLKTVHYPGTPNPGYWFVNEAGLGTNPKFFLAQGDHSGERNRAGVVHWGHGVTMVQDRDKTKYEEAQKAWKKFALKNAVPSDHWLHIHNLFLTYRLRVAGTDNWLSLIYKGRLTALDDPMVRALASRYGDPDDILADEWRPNMPGINTPGSYAQFSKNPREFLFNEVFARIADGTYKYFYTPPSMRVEGGKK